MCWVQSVLSSSSSLTPVSLLPFVQPKLWDWDNVDSDYLSTTGSAQVAATPAIAAPSGGANLRPTTAAAVAAPGTGLEADIMMGAADEGMDEGGYGDDPNRPSTTGAPRASQGAAWGYSRGEQPKEYGDAAGGVPKRPHTAHGGRTGGTPTYQEGEVSNDASYAFVFK